MRWTTYLSPCLAAAAATAAVLAPAPRATAAPVAAGASCAGAGEQGFPLTTRLHDGPTSYDPGGGYGIWYLDLTNITARTCADIHPVVVLVDDKKVLKPSQTELEFYDGPHTRPVPLTKTDESELVGVFDGADFPGFTVAAGATVSVKVRLAVTSDAVRNGVTANAAVVQRRGSDGAWVGESNDYRFGIAGEPPPRPTNPAPAVPSGDSSQAAPQTPRGTSPESPDGSGTSSTGASPEETPDGTPTASPPASAGDSARPVTDEAGGTGEEGRAAEEPREDGEGWEGRGGWEGHGALDAEGAWEAGERARELARTGTGLAHGLLAASATLLAVGASAFLLARRRR
ncbi:hypothetical protein AB0M11_36515 [Streptomyces sp. NPDC051987]|uniref:hypothetical protein n=1 Tax=Streptomyces sp. NPDC051987 TaxID=3155808 RepID=UPI003432F196